MCYSTTPCTPQQKVQKQGLTKFFKHLTKLKKGKKLAVHVIPPHSAYIRRGSNHETNQYWHITA